MAKRREVDSAASTLAFFGSELRRMRTDAGLTQERLGEIISYTGAMVAMVETAKRTPAREFAESVDAALNAGGHFARLWPLVSSGAFPSWFRGFVELEAQATVINKFTSQVVPGLLQTEAYARAVIKAGRPRDTPEEIEERLAARLSRQRILTRPIPPLVWVVLDEAALRRPIGSPAVMCEQLGHLLRLARTPHVIIQVLPFASGAHAALDGPMTLLSFAEGPDVAYGESPHYGQLVDRPEEVAEWALAYDLLQADAQPPEASVAMILSAMEEYST